MMASLHSGASPLPLSPTTTLPGKPAPNLSLMDRLFTLPSYQFVGAMVLLSGACLLALGRPQLAVADHQNRWCTLVKQPATSHPSFPRAGGYIGGMAGLFEGLHGETSVCVLACLL